MEVDIDPPHGPSPNLRADDRQERKVGLRRDQERSLLFKLMIPQKGLKSDLIMMRRLVLQQVLVNTCDSLLCLTSCEASGPSGLYELERVEHEVSRCFSNQAFV